MVFQFLLKSRLIFLLVVFSYELKGQEGISELFHFNILPLGVRGGNDESNLSAYLVGIPDSPGNYICLDAGTLYAGIEKAVGSNLISGDPQSFIRSHIKAYLISHPHLDHAAGLVLNSPDDSPKNIYGLPFCLDILQSHYFTWKSWANFTDQGDLPVLGKYHCIRLDTLIETRIAGTDFFVIPFLLSHSNPGLSTAFLIRYKQSYLLYLGDTGADSVEHSIQLHSLWQAIAPLLKSRQLKGIFIETSFPDEQPTAKLFGHLNPGLFFLEMNDLASLCGAEVLKGFPVLITHIKPVNSHTVEQVHMELVKGNSLKLRLIFPGQAIPLIF